MSHRATAKQWTPPYVEDFTLLVFTVPSRAWCTNSGIFKVLIATASERLMRQVLERIFMLFFFSSLNWYRVLCVSLNGFNWQKLPGATERSCWQINHLCDPKKDAMEENKCPSFIWKLAFGTEVTWKWSSWGMVLLVCLSKSLACRFGLGPQCGFSGKQQPPSPQQWLLSYFFRVVSQLISFDNCVSLWLSGG